MLRDYGKGFQTAPRAADFTRAGTHTDQTNKETRALYPVKACVVNDTLNVLTKRKDRCFDYLLARFMAATQLPTLIASFIINEARSLFECENTHVADAQLRREILQKFSVKAFALGVRKGNRNTTIKYCTYCNCNPT